jgi:hypothetical protein
MSTEDRSIESFEQLFVEIKKYLKLQKEFTLIKLTKKLAVLFATIVLAIVFLILGVAALFYFLFALAYLLEPYVGGLQSSFAIIGLFDLLIIALLYIFRKRLIIKPAINFLAHLLLDDEEEEEKDE